MPKKQTCQQKDDYKGNIICNQETYDQESGLCIFHCKEKPVDEFRESFKKELERVNKDEEIKEIDYRFLIFPDEIDLSYLKFKKKTDFFKATFGHGTRFSSVKFDFATLFPSVTFGDFTSFYQAKFGKGTSFHAATFGDVTSFYQAKFGYETLFDEATFKGKTIFKYDNIQDSKTISMQNLTIDTPNKFKFDHFNLERVELRNTDWTEVEFVGCKWPIKGKRKAVYDEIKDTKREELAAIEQLYNRLQTNFENTKRYADAGDFYIGAMEMRRLQIAKNSNKRWRWIRQNVLSIISWYRMISLYGERYIRPLGWLALFVLLFFPSLYIYSGFEYTDNVIPKDNFHNINYDLSLNFKNINAQKLWDDYCKGLDISFHALTFQRSSKVFNLSIASGKIYIIQSLLCGIIIALFLLAVRRKFGRK